MELSEAQRVSLEALICQGGYDGSVSARAQMVLWRAEGFSVASIARMAGTSPPTVYKWLDRHERFGVGGLTDLPRPGRPPEVPGSVRSRIVALTRCTPPAETGLSHWSSREMAKYLKRAEGISVSHNFIAQVSMVLRLAGRSGAEAVDLDASGDADDAGLIFAGGKSPAFLVARGLARSGRSRTKKAGSRILSRKVARARSAW